MRRARARFLGSVWVPAWGLAVACGGRSGLDECAFGECAGRSAGGALTTIGGAVGSAGASRGGRRNEAAKGGFENEAGRGGTRNEAGIGGAPSGEGGTESGGADAGEGGSGGAPVERELPVVLVLVDSSYSMFLSGVWQPTYEALTAPDGPLERYQDRVELGFASFHGPGRKSEEDPACAEITSVPFALENAGEIRETYGALGVKRGQFETPTGHAITRVTKDLLAYAPDAPKYILFFSDGAPPDTCLTNRPQCGQDRAIFAVQEAFRAGVETRAILVGPGAEDDCDRAQARCLEEHFQDLANAGRGLPVQAPPEAYSALPCGAETGGKLLAEYAEQGVFAPYTWAKSPADVGDAVSSILEQIIER